MIIFIIIVASIATFIWAVRYQNQPDNKNVETKTFYNPPKYQEPPVFKSPDYRQPAPTPAKYVVRTDEQRELDDIEEFKNLTAAQAKKRFKEYKDMGYHFTTKAYVFIIKKINGEVYFTEEEFEKRTSEGKPTAYITPTELKFEKAIEIMLDKELSYEQKMIDIKPIINKYTGAQRTEFAFELYKECILKVMDKVDEEQAAYLKSEKNKITRLFNKGEITSSKMPYNNIQNALLNKPFEDLEILAKLKPKNKKLPE
jgi:hypothetical protein